MSRRDRPGWEPRELVCQCGVPAARWTESAAQRRKLRRMYANADGELPACPTCDDRCQSVDTRDNISLSMRGVGDDAGVRDAVVDESERLGVER
jgi:hypothetical protein